jgi:chemotaxis protein CheD
VLAINGHGKPQAKEHMSMLNLPHEVVLDTGGFHFGGGRTRIRTLLGSCVAITLWHPKRLVGGMCHYLLPRVAAGTTDDSVEGLYADRAMQMFMREIAKIGTTPNEYEVKVFGGGSMLRPPVGVASGPFPIRDIPGQNVAAARDLLEAAGFNIVKQDTGGAGSRQIILELWSGAVWLRRGQTEPMFSRKMPEKQLAYG